MKATRAIRKYPARPDKGGLWGVPRIRRAALFLPNAAGCRYALAGLVDRVSGSLVAAWAGAPGASELRMTDEHIQWEREIFAHAREAIESMKEGVPSVA